jgi:hypothetical protein
VSLEEIIGVVIVGIIVVSFLGRLSPKRRPKEKYFKCSRCGSVSPHTERTIEAWRNNKNKFFCQSCHAKWLQTRSRQEQDQSRGTSRSGCLGLIVLFTLVPLAGYYLVAYA